MESVFQTSEHVSDIVVRFPRSSDIFKDYRIDFCCGGKRPLSEALEEKQLDEGEVLNKLNELYQTSQTQDELTWSEMTSAEVIEQIVHRHHAYLFDELPKLSQFVTKVFQRHGRDHQELGQLHHLFHQLKLDLEQHTIKEENEVFPLIEAYEEDPQPDKRIQLLEAVVALEGEHDVTGDLLKEIRDVTNDLVPPEGACTTYQLTFQRLEDLESDTFEHIHLENNILFPRFQN